MMDAAELESALRRFVEQAVPLVRDTTLPPGLLERYNVGRILREPTFCDTSRHVGGLVAPHRYLVISAEAMALDEEDLPQRGLCILQPDSYLKVIDHSCRGDRAQIVLLHVPDALLSFFRHPGTSRLEEKFAALARECFADCLDLPPIPELDTDGWRERLVFPLGFDDDGLPFPLSCDTKPLPVSEENATVEAPPMFAAGDVVTFDGGVRPGDVRAGGVTAVAARSASSRKQRAGEP